MMQKKIAEMIGITKEEQEKVENDGNMLFMKMTDLMRQKFIEEYKLKGEIFSAFMDLAPTLKKANTSVSVDKQERNGIQLRSLELKATHKLLFAYLMALALIEKRHVDFHEVSETMNVNHPLFVANHDMLILLSIMMEKQPQSITAMATNVQVQAAVEAAIQMQESFAEISCIKGEMLAFYTIYWLLEKNHDGFKFNDEAKTNFLKNMLTQRAEQFSKSDEKVAGWYMFKTLMDLAEFDKKKSDEILALFKVS